MNRNSSVALSVLLAATLVPGPVWAGEREDLEVIRQTTVNLIQALVEKGVLTKDSANALIKQAEESARKKVAETKAEEANVVRVPYVPESVKREIREQVKQEVVTQAKAERWGDVNAVPEWVLGMKFEGDLRIREQTDRYAQTNGSPAVINSYYGLTSTSPTTENRDRLRLRARLGLTTKISDMVSAGLRLATGTTSDPGSTNQTLGDYTNKYTFLVDQAYLKVQSLDLQERVDGFSYSAIGGRIPNPWLSTDLVWDPDINFEGVAANTTYRFNERHSVYLTAGAFPLQDVSPSTTNKAKSKWLYGAQVGMDLTAQSGSKARFGAAIYDFAHVEGIREIDPAVFYYDATAPAFRQKGNSIFTDPYSGKYKLSSKFRELNLTAQLDLATFDPNHVLLTADYVKNIGFDAAEIAARTQQAAPEKRTMGYQLQAAFGRPKVQAHGEWQAFAGYRYLQRDAVLDAFTDSDFHLGGTDAKGYFLGGSYGLDRNTWLSMKWMSGDTIDGPKYGIDVLQVDLNAKF